MNMHPGFSLIIFLYFFTIFGLIVLGLFRGAILESGSPLSPWSFLSSNSSREYAFDLAKQINSSIDFSNNSSLLLDFLVNIDAKIIDVASTRTTISRPLPVIETEHNNAFLTESQYKLLETGDFIRVPIIIGTNSEEEIHRASGDNSVEDTQSNNCCNTATHVFLLIGFFRNGGYACKHTHTPFTGVTWENDGKKIIGAIKQGSAGTFVSRIGGRLDRDLASLNKTLQSYEKNPEKFIPDDFAVKDEVNTTIVGISIRDLYLQNVSEDEKMGHIVKFLSHTSFTTSMIKHADLVSNYTDVYFYVFSYDGPMGNVNITVKVDSIAFSSPLVILIHYSYTYLRSVPNLSLFAETSSGADKIDHAEDPKYLFKKYSGSYSNVDLSKFPESDILTHNRLIELWTNFVKYSNPTPESSALLQDITWPKFSSDGSKFVDIGRNLEIKENPKSPYYKAWVKFYEDWAEKPFITF